MQADPTAELGRLIRSGEMSEDDAQPLHRGTGGGMYTRKAHATGRQLEIWTVSDGNGFQIVRFTDTFKAGHKDLLEDSGG